MFLSKIHVSRRTVLKGVGATIALPLLDAMSPASTAFAKTAAGAAPKRFAFVGFPHGAGMDRRAPAQAGAGRGPEPLPLRRLPAWPGRGRGAAGADGRQLRAVADPAAARGVQEAPDDR